MGKIDFIGLGAQKSGTSWVYACLYEHPEICAPVKEIHFFSRPRFSEGRDWYENHFRNCKPGAKSGEFSTSYLYSKATPNRIKNLYPGVKLIAILRQPVERAYSQYRNAIKAGEVSKDTQFEAYVKAEPSAIEQGLYAEQLERYYEYFPKEQVLVLKYEDSKADPAGFIKSIYRFLGVEDSFIPSMLNTEINIARTPKNIGVERVMHHMAETLRKVGFDKAVWAIKKSGLPDMVRKANTEEKSPATQTKPDLTKYSNFFSEDTEKLGTMIGRDMKSEWGI